jgi:hypothetical protein
MSRTDLLLLTGEGNLSFWQTIQSRLEI